MRFLQSELGATLARADMAGIGMTHVAKAKRGEHEIFQKYPDLNTDDGRRMVVDVLQSFIDRAKSAQ